MEIRNKTLYDKDLIIRYNHYYLMDFLKKNSLFVILTACGFGAYLLVQNEWEYALAMVGILAAYFLLAIVMQMLTTKRAVKRSPIVANPVYQTYVFKEDEVEIFNIKARTIKYENIIRIKESKEFLIVYDLEKKTFIVDKNGFEADNDLNILKDFLKEKLGKKYRK
ncbi:MAG TPA: YcxB family protein [Bacillota bacterium]|nr:YcxB family protein [Bacillota bacterium]HPF42147.1 YcxB family protein [Bacillota bacterium]HPJ85651.1 YcxB family protein [Bacillota bacterium]HPQ61712.1 YcxB family protein [Bacillota bacterium]